MRASVLVKLAIGLALVGLGGWVAWNRLYAVEAGELRVQLEELRDQNASYERALEAAPAQRRWIRDLESRLVGGARDDLDNGVRIAVRRVGEAAGLDAIEVDTDSSLRAVRNPYAESRQTRRSAIGRALRESPDFGVLRVSLSGEGALERVMRTVAGVRAQPWLHRVDQVSVEPTNQDRTRYSVSLAMWVAHTRSASAMAPGELEVVEPSRADMARARRILDANPFRHEPPPEPEPEPEEREPDPAPPPPPYGAWRVWGVIESRRGTEVGVRNERTGRSLTLSVGDAVPGLPATLVGGEGDRAIFEIDGERFVVRLNQTLDERARAEASGGDGSSPML